MPLFIRSQIKLLPNKKEETRMRLVKMVALLYVTLLTYMIVVIRTSAPARLFIHRTVTGGSSQSVPVAVRPALREHLSLVPLPQLRPHDDSLLITFGIVLKSTPFTATLNEAIEECIRMVSSVQHCNLGAYKLHHSLPNSLEVMYFASVPNKEARKSANALEKALGPELEGCVKDISSGLPEEARLLRGVSKVAVQGRDKQVRARVAVGRTWLWWIKAGLLSLLLVICLSYLGVAQRSHGDEVESYWMDDLECGDIEDEMTHVEEGSKARKIPLTEKYYPWTWAPNPLQARPILW